MNFKRRFCLHLEMRIGTIILDCAQLDEPNACTVEQIARFQLAARARGVDLRLANASRSLVDLIEFCGLAGVLRVEPERQAE
jgi:anti-anti-sigma regulatory factor